MQALVAIARMILVTRNSGLRVEICGGVLNGDLGIDGSTMISDIE